MTDYDVQVVGDDDLPPGQDWALWESDDGDHAIVFVKALALARHPMRTLSECETGAEVSAGQHRNRLLRVASRLWHRHSA